MIRIVAVLALSLFVGGCFEETVTEKPFAGSIGASCRHRQKRVESGSAGTDM